MFKPSLCDYSDEYILIKGGITVSEVGVTKAARKADANNKQAISKNFTLLMDCIIEINST